MINELTKSEIAEAVNNIKKFNGLEFIYQDNKGSNFIFNWVGNAFEIILDQNEEVSLKERKKLNNLIKWNSEITIKIIHLRNTFIYMSTYLNRYKKGDIQKDQQYFRYFAEIISYYFVSVRDCILQFINSFLEDPVEKEYQVTLKSIKEKLSIENVAILNALNEFEDNTRKFREEIRNGFTHKSNPFNHYYIVKLENENSLGVSDTNTIDNDKFFDIILQNIEFLSSYIEALRKEIK